MLEDIIHDIQTRERTLAENREQLANFLTKTNEEYRPLAVRLLLEELAVRTDAFFFAQAIDAAAVRVAERK